MSATNHGTPDSGHAVTTGQLARWHPAQLTSAAAEVEVVRCVVDAAARDLRSAAERAAAAWSGEASSAASAQLHRHADLGDRIVVALGIVRRTLRASGEATAAAAALLTEAEAAATHAGLVLSPSGTAHPLAASDTTDADATDRATVMARQALAAATEADADASAVLRSAAASMTGAAASATPATTSTAVAAIGARPVPGVGTPPEIVAAWWASLPPMTQAGTIARCWREIGNLDGVPLDARAAANRFAVDRAARDGTISPELAHGLAGRSVVLFDPEHGRYAELVGQLTPLTTAVAVLLGGTGTRLAGMAGQRRRADSFVTAASPPGSVAVITYLGGPMPQNIADAASPEAAIDQATGLRDFVAGLGLGPAVRTSVVAHSYAGSLVGASEVLGLSVDAVVHVESAGAGPGVDSVGDYADPTTEHYSMTAPFDPIELSQGVNGFGLGHGADPDTLPGFTRLATGRVDADDPTSPLLTGPEAHSGVFTPGSTAWVNILGVITGGEVTTVHDTSP